MTQANALWFLQVFESWTSPSQGGSPIEPSVDLAGKEVVSKVIIVISPIKGSEQSDETFIHWIWLLIWFYDVGLKQQSPPFLLHIQPHRAANGPSMWSGHGVKLDGQVLKTRRVWKDGVGLVKPTPGSSCWVNFQFGLIII